MFQWLRLTACLVALRGAVAQLPPYSPELRDSLWDKAHAQVGKMKPGDYVGQNKYSCSSGTWGDGPQCNQWDSGFSPCWPSAMTISASWDPELMARWSREMAMEFGAPNRGQLAPGVNIARYPWNGRLGEYMSGEDPYFGARMVETMVTAYRDIDKPPLQTVKHFIPNTIEKGRMDGTEVVDERTLFEVYYPAFQAAVDAGMSAVMCSYNLVDCTSGLCDTGVAYACVNHDILVKHLKGVMGFKGIVISDWDATKCQDAAAKSGGCTAGSYVEGKYAATGGLDLEMPDCMSLGGGFTNVSEAKEKAIRTRWAYLVQGREFDSTEQGENVGWFSEEESHDEPSTPEETQEQPAQKKTPKGNFCCFWPIDSKDICAMCEEFDDSSTKGKCAQSETNIWCEKGKAIKMTASANSKDAPAPNSPDTPEKVMKKQPAKATFCCFWPTDSEDICAMCEQFDETYTKGKCAESETNIWCDKGKAIKMTASIKAPDTREKDMSKQPAKHQTFCCFWATDSEDVCASCESFDDSIKMGKCAESETNVWCDKGKEVKMTSTTKSKVPIKPAVSKAPTSPTTSAPALPASKGKKGAFCCYWPTGGEDICSNCESSSLSDTKAECAEVDTNTWCTGEADRTPSAATPRALSDHNGEIDRRHDKKKAGKTVKNMCPHKGAENYKSPCKLDLANQIIAESSVVLKNKGGVLPISKKATVALAGSEACDDKPLAIAGGSGWNGDSCQANPYINIKDGISKLSGATTPSCPTSGGENPKAASADVIVIVVVPEEACEGRDRNTLQLDKKDVELIKKYSKLDVPVVVVMNAPGPMITNTWDEGVEAILMTWLPGTQNGNGIARALYGEEYEASGRLPFTFPKCSSQACTKQDEFDGSIPLGDQIKNKKYWTLAEKALIGYRWYHAKGIEPNYPFGHGLFAYGRGSVTYEAKEATSSSDGTRVEVELSHDSPVAGKDVPQLYLKFPGSVPGPPEIKPEWILKGFTKVLLEPGKTTKVTFNLTNRDLSYWDDSKGMSKWVCASGAFTACIGANARDAVAKQGSNCKAFTSKCSDDDAGTLVVKKFAPGVGWPASGPASGRWTAVAASAAAVASLAALAAAAGRRRWALATAGGTAAPRPLHGGGQRSSSSQVLMNLWAGETSDQEPFDDGSATSGGGL